MKSALEINPLTAKHIMNPEVAYVTVKTKVGELANYLQAQGITGVPVVNLKGKVVGIVSETDIVAAETAKENQLSAEEKNVEEIMTPGVVSVDEDTPAAEIAQKMLADRVHRVLVMDSKNHLKGIVTSMDLVRLVAESAYPGTENRQAETGKKNAVR